jgi:hypothetical protein
MVAIGVSGVEDRSEPRLAREFGLGGTRWHGVGLILDDVRWHKIWIKWVKYCSNPHITPLLRLGVSTSRPVFQSNSFPLLGRLGGVNRLVLEAI